MKKSGTVHCRDEEAAMDENSITVRVYVGSLLFPCGPFTLHGFKASDSISDVKERICQKAPELGDPDIGIMWSHRHQLEDNETLGSLFSPGCTDLTISLYYLPIIGEKITKNPNKKEINWLPICKCVRFREEAHEENMDREDDYMRNPVSIVKRPKTIHAPLPPFAELSDLGIHGQYVLLDSENRSIPVSRIRFATSVQTPASVILLAPSDEILKDLIDLNTESKYLVVRVFWDKLSYFFLRTLRTSYPDSPIVAVTDFNPHHLDLLTFLDTPPKDLPCCYGWNLSGDFEDVGASNIDFLNIRWLGLRLDDCDGLLSSFDGSARSPPGFRAVIRMLRVNPFLRRKKDWLAALDWLDEFGKSVSFHPPSPADPDDCHLHLGVDFIAKKLSKKDWV